MSLKDDVKDVSDKIKGIKTNTSFALEIIHDLKVENKTIKILLGLSIIANIIIVLLLR